MNQQRNKEVQKNGTKKSEQRMKKSIWEDFLIITMQFCLQVRMGSENGLRNVALKNDMFHLGGGCVSAYSQWVQASLIGRVTPSPLKCTVASSMESLGRSFFSGPEEALADATMVARLPRN